jgi:glutathione S-transferase
MKLYNNRPSPYGRLVLVVAHEKRLMDRLEVQQIDPWSDPGELLAATPVGKVPALVTADGSLIIESTTISEYFDAIGSGPKLVGADRWRVMGRAALARGIIDAAFAIAIERRRPAERQWQAWIDRQQRAIRRTVERLAAHDEACEADRFDLGDIALASGLAYMDFRLPDIAWRRHDRLAEWLDRIAERPSMLATTPAPALNPT